MNNVTLFSSYGANENTVSNYCAALMEKIYNHGPDDYNRLLEILLSDYGQVPVFGPSFSQQTAVNNGGQSSNAKQKSISDIEIAQWCVRICFETKLHHSGFATDQLNRYITNMLSGDCCCRNFLIMLSNFDGDDPKETKAYQDACKYLQQNGKKNCPLSIAAIDFEQLIDAMETCCSNVFLQELIADFRTFLDEMQLLPSWKNRMIVVNATASLPIFNSDNAYFCPFSYNHRRAMFMACYKDKQICQVHKIKGVVKVSYQSASGKHDASVVFNNDSIDVTQLKNEAIRIVSTHCAQEVKRHDMKVFLLTDKNEVSYCKSSRGGMQTSKMYVEHMNSKYSTAKAIANEVNNKTWLNKQDIENQLK